MLTYKVYIYHDLLLCIISADGNLPSEFLEALKQNNWQDELRVHYGEEFVLRYVIPYAVQNEDIVGLAELYAWSTHESVKCQVLQNLNSLLHRPSCLKKNTLGKQLINTERILRPKHDDTNLKDKNVIMVFLEVYRLVISLLYIAIVTGDVKRDDIADILEHGRDANGVLEGQAQQLYNLNFDHDLVKSHMYIIGKFLKVELYRAVESKKSQTVRVIVMQLIHLMTATLTSDEITSIKKAMKSSISCLTSKFQQHVTFYYLTILVSCII